MGNFSCENATMRIKNRFFKVQKKKKNRYFLQKNGLFQSDFSPTRKRFSKKNLTSYLKENCQSFQKIYRKSQLSLSVTEISRDKDTRFFRVQNSIIENCKIGGTSPDASKSP